VLSRLGLVLSPDKYSPEITVQHAIWGETKGHRSVWIAEMPGSGDQFCLLGYLAARAKVVQLATGIASTYLRHRVQLAMAAATADALSNGRFALGIGAGVKLWIEEDYGMKFERPVDNLKESIGIIRTLLDGSEVNYEGKQHTAKCRLLPERPK
jgi:alkanesulfonate monooxygenase SsuD/methylene tetrahydromethanopterin reductase-like flavin-dependent oxidoreductase (luciferase family)